MLLGRVHHTGTLNMGVSIKVHQSLHQGLHLHNHGVQALGSLHTKNAILSLRFTRCVSNTSNNSVNNIKSVNNGNKDLEKDDHDGKEAFHLHNAAGCRQRKRVLDVYKFDHNGTRTRVKYALSELAEVHARDLLSMAIADGTGDRFRRQSPKILPRSSCILVAVSHIKAVIFHDHVLLLDLQRPVVHHFANYLQHFLMASREEQHTMTMGDHKSKRKAPPPLTPPSTLSSTSPADPPPPSPPLTPPSPVSSSSHAASSLADGPTVAPSTSASAQAVAAASSINIAPPTSSSHSHTSSPSSSASASSSTSSSASSSASEEGEKKVGHDAAQHAATTHATASSPHASPSPEVAAATAAAAALPSPFSDNALDFGPSGESNLLRELEQHLEGEAAPLITHAGFTEPEGKIEEFGSLSTLLLLLRRPSSDDSRSVYADSDNPLHFEMRVLEAMLSFVSKKYERRLQCFDPVINDLLVDLTNANKEVIDSDVLHRLLPLKNSLSAFERSAEELLTALTELLKNEEDMTQMNLSDKQSVGKLRRGGSAAPLSHENVELLLENYHREISDVVMGAFLLRKKIQNSQDMMRIFLDNYRNKMMKVNAEMAMAAVGIGAGTLGAGVFGMNLMSGFEDSKIAFYTVTIVCCAISAATYLLARGWARVSPLQARRVADMHRVLSLMDNLGDIQDIVLTHFPDDSSSVDKAELLQLLRAASGQPVTAEMVDLIFRVYERNKDGRLTKKGISHFLCDLQAQHAVFNEQWARQPPAPWQAGNAANANADSLAL